MYPSQYPGAHEAGIKGISSFVAKPGQTTAFIGSTGARKINTLIHLSSSFL